jgi:hypothetical protein
MFIRDLHYSIEECFENEEPNTSLEWLYRGQHMLIVEFEKLKNNVGGLFSVYNFFSTTEYKELATIYAGQSVDDEIAVLFEIEIKSSFVADIPFADIGNLSHFDDGEREWLFSMCSIFRIEQVQCDNDGRWSRTIRD